MLKMSAINLLTFFYCPDQLLTIQCVTTHADCHIVLFRVPSHAFIFSEGYLLFLSGSTLTASKARLLKRLPPSFRPTLKTVTTLSYLRVAAFIPATSNKASGNLVVGEVGCPWHRLGYFPLKSRQWPPHPTYFGVAPSIPTTSKKLRHSRW